MRWLSQSLVALFIVSSCQIEGANLLENSSFEAGDLHGWGFGGESFPRKTPFFTTNNAAWHGSRSIRLECVATNLNVNYVVSRVYWLKPNTRYTLSCYAKKDARMTVAGVLHMFPVNSDQVREGQPYKTYNVGPAAFVLTTSWNRYSYTFTTHSNPNATGYLIHLWNHWTGVNGGAPNQFIQVDAVQLEEGTRATKYAPLADVEVGANLVRVKPGHVFHASDTVALDFTSFNNTGSQSEPVLQYQVRDLWNTVHSSGSFRVEAWPRSSHTNTITLSNLPLGYLRMTYWIDGQPGSLNDLQFSRVLPPVALPHRTNGMFGLHLLNQPYYLEAAQRIGVHWNRLMSVERQGKWVEIEPVPGRLTVNTQSVALNRKFDIEPVMNVIATEFRNGVHAPNIPNWATNNFNLWPATNMLYAHLTNLVTNYKDWCSYYEIMNEQARPEPDTYPAVLTWAHRAIRDADPNAKIVAFADFYAANNKRVLDRVGADKADIWSTHLYAYDAAGNDKIWDYQASHMSAYPSIPVWQTEAGLRTESPSAANFWEQTFVGNRYPDGDQFTRGARYRLIMMAHMFHYAWRDPMQVWFYYDGRTVTGYDNPIQFSVFDYDQTMRPQGIMMAATAQRLEDARKMGRFKLDSRVDAFWYLSRSNLASILLYGTNNDTVPTILGGEGRGRAAGVPKVKLVSTLKTNEFVLYDLLGNVLPYPPAGYSLGMDPVWVEARPSTGTNELLRSLRIVNGADTKAPNLQIVTWPLAAHAGPLLFRWNSIDDYYVDVRWNGLKGAPHYNVNTNAIRYRSKISPMESNYGPWTNTSWRLANVNWTPESSFSVQAIDGAGNITTETVPSASGSRRAEAQAAPR